MIGHQRVSRPQRRRTLLSIAGAMVAGLALLAAGVSSGARKAQPTVAFISQGTSNSWAAQLDAVAKKTAAADGLKLVYYNGQGDATKQLPEISTAAATHPDAIVLVPLGF